MLYSHLLSATAKMLLAQFVHPSDRFLLESMCRTQDTEANQLADMLLLLMMEILSLLLVLRQLFKDALFA